jgi:hypothetical protein
VGLGARALALRAATAVRACYENADISSRRSIWSNRLNAVESGGLAGEVAVETRDVTVDGGDLSLKRSEPPLHVLHVVGQPVHLGV